MHNMTSTRTLPKKKTASTALLIYGIVIALPMQHMCDHVAPPSLQCKNTHLAINSTTLHRRVWNSTKVTLANQKRIFQFLNINAQERTLVK